MNFAEITLLDYFFPFADTQKPQLAKHGSVAYRVLEGPTSDRIQPCGTEPDA